MNVQLSCRDKTGKTGSGDLLGVMKRMLKHNRSIYANNVLVNVFDHIEMSMEIREKFFLWSTAVVTALDYLAGMKEQYGRPIQHYILLEDMLNHHIDLVEQKSHSRVVQIKYLKR